MLVAEARQARPPLFTRSASRSGRLLPLGPFPLRQGRRAGDFSSIRARTWSNGGTARGEALAKDYIAKRYHQPDDEYSPDWDMTGIVEDAALLHAVGRGLANSTQWPNWSEDSEFRAARDQTERRARRAARSANAAEGKRPWPIR